MTNFDNSEMGDFIRRQEISQTFISNGSCFATTRKILFSGRIIGTNCAGFLTDKERYIDIDEPFDLKIAELMFQNFSR